MALCLKSGRVHSPSTAVTCRPHPAACPSLWSICRTHSALQAKFEERWQALMAPRLAEEELAARGDEGAVLQKRMEAHQARTAAHGAAL